MPKPSQSGFKRFFYNQNIKRDKSNDKYKNLHNHVVLLLKKIEKEGVTKWAVNAVARAQSKLTSYGVSFKQIVAILEHKGLSHLQESLQNTFSFVDQKSSSKLVVEKKTVEKKPAAPKKVKEVKTEDAPVVEKKPAAKKPAAPKKATTEKKPAAPKKAKAE